MAWNPNDVGTIQWALDTEYGANYTALDGVPVLNSLETHGDDRAPRGQRCYLFDGTGTAVIVPGSDVSNLTWTLSGNVLFQRPDTAQYVLSQSDGTGTGTAWLFQSSANQWKTSIGGAFDFTALPNIQLGVWYSYSMTHDAAAQTISLTVNGNTQVATGRNMVAANGSFNLGKSKAGAGFLLGKMHGLNLTNKFSLPCNEESGGTCFDSSGNNNHGTIQNANLESFHSIDSGVLSNPANSLGHTNNAGVIVPRNEAIPAQDVLGGALQFSGKSPNPIQIESPCATFDGVDDNVNLSAHVSAFQADTIGSISVWFKTSVSGASQVLFSASVATAASNDLTMRLNGSDQCQMHIRNFGNIVLAASPLTYTDGQWHHYLWTMGTGGSTVYIDGAVITMNYTAGTAATQAWFASVPSLSASYFGINEDSGGLEFPFSGSLVSTAIYNRDLTASEAAFLYDGSGTDPGTANLVGQWPMQEGSGATVFDVSGAGNHGTVTNASLAAFWANRSNSVQDHSINYGGRWDVLVFVPGLLDGSGAADGNPLDFSGDHLPNQGSRIIFDPYGAPELSPLNFPALSTVGEDLRIVAPNETKFRSLRNDAAAADPLGDRYLTAVPSTLSGADLQNMLDYLSGNLPPDFVAAWAANSTRLISGSLAGA